jgi:fido (protein-threonine AMPylation protein)
MDAFFSLIHENWTIVEHPTMLAAFALWNLNWIHPFIEGNGRTARAVSQTAKLGHQAAPIKSNVRVPDPNSNS